MYSVDITKSNYIKLSRDIDSLSFILTLKDALPKNLTHTLTLSPNHNLTDVIEMSRFQPKGKL